MTAKTDKEAIWTGSQQEDDRVRRAKARKPYISELYVIDPGSLGGRSISGLPLEVYREIRSRIYVPSHESVLAFEQEVPRGQFPVLLDIFSGHGPYNLRSMVLEVIQSAANSPNAKLVLTARFESRLPRYA